MRLPRWAVPSSGVVIRVIADLIIVQTAMLAAVAAVALGLAVRPEQPVSLQLAILRTHYITVLLPLSILFPLINGALGLYTRLRAYRLSVRLRRAAMGSGIGALGLIAVSLTVNGLAAFPLSNMAIFSVLVILGTPASRYLKFRIFASDTGCADAVMNVPPVNGPILVVGGAGYIGSIVVRKLLQRGYSVRVLDSLVYGISAIQDVLQHPNLQFVKGDARNMQDVIRAMESVRSVIDLAAIVGDPACERDQQTAREINYAATRMMIEVAKGEHVERFIFASSCSVYGASDDFMDEDSGVSPISLYAETKVDSEEALLAAASKTFHPTILRLSTIFGLSPRPRFDLVVNLLTAKAIQEGVATIFNGEQWRPFLHVGDAAEAFIRVLEAPAETVGNQIYNIGDDRLNYTLSQVGEIILRVFPTTRIEQLESLDRRNYRVSFDRAHRQLGFRASQSVEAGIREIKAAFEDGRISDYRSPLYSNAKFLQEHGSPVQTDMLGARVMAALAVCDHVQCRDARNGTLAAR